MGISFDTPLTTDADFITYAIQNLTNTSPSGDWTEVHKGATNSLFVRLSGHGDPTKITNEDIWDEYVICNVAERIYAERALGSRGDEGFWDKVAYYKQKCTDLWERTLAATTWDTDGDGSADKRSTKALPIVINHDGSLARQDPFGRRRLRGC